MSWTPSDERGRCKMSQRGGVQRTGRHLMEQRLPNMGPSAIHENKVKLALWRALRKFCDKLETACTATHNYDALPIGRLNHEPFIELSVVLGIVWHFSLGR